MKIYGPYKRKDGRKHIIIQNDNKKTTVSYPKWLMEQHLKRSLEPDETVDHVNRDFTDDRLENLTVKKRSVHTSDDSLRVQLVEIVCVWCIKKSFKKPGVLHHNSKQGKAGPFCGRSCAGKYGKSVQMGESVLPTQRDCPIEKRKYFYKEKT